MHFHVPKRSQAWREFLGEMIALTAPSAAEPAFQK